MWHSYHVVSSLDEALSRLAQHGRRARVIAGGTDLLLELERGARPGVDTLIDVTRVPGLASIAADDHGVRLGALVRHNDCLASPLIRRRARALAQACWEVGAPQIRNRATLAGNLITASPANDTIAPLMALGATVTLQSVRGKRSVPLSDFYTGLRQTVMAADELVTSIYFPLPPENTRSMFIKLGLRKAQAISVVNVAVVAALEDTPAGPVGRGVRISLGAVAPTIVRASAAEASLEGQLWDDATLARAAEAAKAGVRPIDDLRGPAAYRADMVRVIVQRALSAVRDDRTQGWLPDDPVLLWGARAGRSDQGLPGAWQSAKGTGDTQPIGTTVNGQRHTVRGAAGKTLLAMLRDDLALTGTKEGCAEGECGACTVYLNGAAVMSCLVPAPSAHAAEIVTIEGLQEADRMSRLQQSFVDHGAVQCGYCTPGLAMAGAKVLEERGRPTRWEAQQAIAGNLCRCTGYYKVLDAIEHAARAPAAVPPGSA